MDGIELIEYINHSVDYTVFDVKWIPFSAKFVVVGVTPDRTGVLEIFELDGAKVSPMKSTKNHCGFTCASLGASRLTDRQLAVGDYVGRLQILDLERLGNPTFNLIAHKTTINAIDAIGGTRDECGAPEVVTGCRDGSIKIWDPRQGEEPVVNITPSSIKKPDLHDCWTVSFGDSFSNYNRCVVAGFDNGDLRLFDLRTLKVRWEDTQLNGICSIEFDQKYIPMNRMVVTTMEGGLFIYDMSRLNAENRFDVISEKIEKVDGSDNNITGPRATVWAVRHLPQNNNLFATCGGAGTLRLWEYRHKTTTPEMKLICAKNLSSQPLKCFDWNSDKEGLAVVGSFDKNIRVVVATNLSL